MLLLELEGDELEWIFACCRLHAKGSEFQAYVIHLLESYLPAAVCLWRVLLQDFYWDWNRRKHLYRTKSTFLNCFMLIVISSFRSLPIFKTFKLISKIGQVRTRTCFILEVNFKSMLLLELKEDQLEWIIACCRLHANGSECQAYVIHLLESYLSAVVCLWCVL